MKYKNNDEYKEYTGYNREVLDDDGNKVAAGEVFTAFDDVLSPELKKDLYKIKGNLMDVVDEDIDLDDDVFDDDIEMTDEIDIQHIQNNNP